MQTHLTETILNTRHGKEADAILRMCVHCGFCTAVCPTYQLLGSEPDSPRGRIYLIKQALEGNPVSPLTQLHLDRCLGCRACESSCPSGVQYGRLLDIGRDLVATKVKRPLGQRIQRALLGNVIPYPRRFTPLLRMGQALRPMLPTQLRSHIPARQDECAWPQRQHARKMLILEGCVQSAAAPRINTATAYVLDQLDIELVRTRENRCCGAVQHHLTKVTKAQQAIRKIIDEWWPYVEQGAEAIVINASGCGSMVKEYGVLMAHDPDYAEKAKRISALCKDITEILADEDLERLAPRDNNRRVAFHSPCSLQHGQKIEGVVETILQRCGYTLTSTPDAHLCCGSAGTYSLLQKELSQQLLNNKIESLESDQPELIATANIGCLLHMQTKSSVPVCHWIELLED